MKGSSDKDNELSKQLDLVSTAVPEISSVHQNQNEHYLPQMVNYRN